MIFDKGLKGTDLLVYAIIAKYSMDGGFYGNLQYLADWTGASRASIKRSLKYLLENKLIERRTLYLNGDKTNPYAITDEEWLKMSHSRLKMNPVWLKMSHKRFKMSHFSEIEKSKKEKYQKKEVKEICDIEAISSNTLQKNIDTAISQSKDSDDIVSATSKNTTNDTTNPKTKINNKNKKLTKPELDALKAKMIDEYTSNEKLKSAIREYDLMREQTHKPIATEYTMKLVFRNLNRLAPVSDEDKIKVLEQSILKNWQGLFPVKDDGVREMTEAEIADQKILDKIFG